MWWGPSRNLTNKNSAGARACAGACRLWGILTKCKKVKVRAHARARTAGDGEF